MPKSPPRTLWCPEVGRLWFSVGAFVAAFAVSSFVCSALSGQSISGTVREAGTGVPIGHAEITLLGRGRPTGVGIYSDTAGWFLLSAPRAGSYAIQVRRVGYVPLVTPAVLLEAAQEVEFDVPLTRAAGVVLDTVDVVVPRNNPGLGGFEERRRGGVGTFFTRQDIEERGEPRLTDLLRGLPGVVVAATGRGRTTASTSRSTGTYRCLPVLFVDGVVVTRSSDSPEVVRGVLETLTGNVLDAVEVYKGRSELPARFGGPDVRCGAIVAWTRRGKVQVGHAPP